MIRSAVAKAAMLAASAFLVSVGKVLAKYFKSVFPDIFESILENVSLDKLGTSFYIKTGDYVTVCLDACRIYTCGADKIPVTNSAFVFKSETVTATIFQRISFKTFFPYLLYHSFLRNSTILRNFFGKSIFFVISSRNIKNYQCYPHK